MSAASQLQRSEVGADVELVTFYVADLLLGAEIGFVEEINRQTNLTPVPHAPESVRGVMNLRGDVVTVLDLRTILGLGRTETGKDVRNVVINATGERIGLLVDRVADVLMTRRDEIDPPPPNMIKACGRFLEGVCKLDRELLAVLNIPEVLAAADTVA
jgi:purine-binding chemotaxis protein CheW